MEFHGVTVRLQTVQSINDVLHRHGFQKPDTLSMTYLCIDSYVVFYVFENATTRATSFRCNFLQTTI